MAKADFLKIVLLSGSVFLLSSCGMDVVEPPSLTLDDPLEGEVPGGTPSEWGTDTCEPQPGWCPYGKSVAEPKKITCEPQSLPEEPPVVKQSPPANTKKSGSSLYDPWLVEESDVRDMIPQMSRPQPEDQQNRGAPCDQCH